jgi:hypothetical protein
MSFQVDPLCFLRHSTRALFIGLCLLTMAFPAHADDNLKVLQAFYANRLPDQQQLRDAYTNFTYRPYGRKELTFNVLVPAKDWRDIPISISPETLKQDAWQLIPLAHQKAPQSEKGEADIQVAYMRMNLEISLHDVVNRFFAQNNMDVLMRRQGEFNQRKVEDVLVMSKQNSKDYIARFTFSRNGDIVFVVTGSALKSEFCRYARTFAAAAVSFEVHHKAAQPCAEPTVAFTSSGTPELEFKYPKRWAVENLQGPASKATEVNLKWVTRDEKGQHVTTHGYIHVRAVAKRASTSPDDILSKLKKDFEGLPMSFKQCALKATVLPDRSPPVGTLERWQVTVGGSPGEAAFLLLPHGDDYFALGLLSKRPKDNWMTWAHTWRVFEMVANDLAGHSMALTEIKDLSLPSDKQLKQLVNATLEAFCAAVQQGNFGRFYDDLANFFKVQTSAVRLRSAFGSFAGQKELQQIARYSPILENGIRIDEKGLLEIAGHYPTQPQAIRFKLSFLQEGTRWKLLGIHVAMK